MSYFLMRPCKTTAAFVATLRRPLALDLGEAREILARKGYRVTDCGVLLLLHDAPERTLYRTGRILVKGGEEDGARQAVEEVYEALRVVERLPA